GDEPGRLRFDVDVRGKPSLCGVARGMLSPRRTAALHFNLAHSGDGVLVAVGAAGAVGVDLEVRRTVRDAERLARRFFTPAEAAAIAACDEPERSTAFLMRWTCKEAMLKASGIGIVGGLNMARASGILSTALHALSPAPGYLAAVAGPGYDRIVGRRCLPALH
ncbi:MAG: 4'-phosphopantetheinyl transferase superfamily protein, partial [Candidatus Eremiobacteraeota bacterium]|nr:4'-phosphopantetheinyl transferase superfamily protein [Candidatus Eremiobacteraeota bacterium]